MIKFQQAEDKKQEVVNARALERERREDISKRNNAADIEDNMPQEVQDVSEPIPEREYKKIVDTASTEEIQLFAYAMSLGSALADKKIIKDPKDIIRPDDFAGDTIKELVRIFLNVFDGKNETLFAKMSDYFESIRKCISWNH